MLHFFCLISFFKKFPAPFSLFSSFLLVDKIFWIWTVDLWCWKRLLYQLSHNHCPMLDFLSLLSFWAKCFRSSVHACSGVFSRNIIFFSNSTNNRSYWFQISLIAGNIFLEKTGKSESAFFCHFNKTSGWCKTSLNEEKCFFRRLPLHLDHRVDNWDLSLKQSNVGNTIL